MFKKRILSSLMIAVFILTLSSVTSVFAASEITWDVISNDQIMSNVTENLNLVKTLDGDVAVSWTSSKPHCVDTNGVVTRWEKDEAVTLTAAYGEETKTFNIVVSSYENGKTIWTDDNFAGKNLTYQAVKWNTTSTDSATAAILATSPMIWKYDAENDRLYTETQWGRWDYDYGMNIDGTSYKWANLAAVKADTRLKNVSFTYASTSYTFYYIDKAFVDAENKPYRVGVVATNDSYLKPGWVSFYVNVDEDTDAISVDTTLPLALALEEGAIKPNFEPVVVDIAATTSKVKYNAHLYMMGQCGFPAASATKDLVDGYERFSFRYRQIKDANQAEKWEPNFEFYYNNKRFAINPNGGPGAMQTASAHAYYGNYIPAYYDLSTGATFNIGSASSTAVSMLGSADEALAVKTSTDGLTDVTKLTGATYHNWRDIVMVTDRAQGYTVMYIDGNPVYWKGTVSGTDYYSPFIVHTNYASTASSTRPNASTSADSARTGFSVPWVRKLFTSFEVENVKLERITPAEIVAASADPVVKSVEGNDAVINFARKGSFTVVFTEYDEEDGTLSNASMKNVTVTTTGDNTVTASVTPDADWDKIFIWSAPGSMIPVCTSVNIADLAATE